MACIALALLVHIRHPAQQWFTTQNVGPSPSGRSYHAMISNGTRLFMLGGKSEANAPADEIEVIHVLETSMYFLLSFHRQPPSLKTEHIEIPNPDLNAVKPRETTRRILKKDDNRFERQRSATLATQTERDQRLAQLTEELAPNGALFETGANAAEPTKHAGLDPRELIDRLLVKTSLVEQKDAELVKIQGKLDELVLSRDQHALALEQAQRAHADEYKTELAKVRAELEAKKSELEAIRSRLTDAEIGWAKSKTEADTLRALNTTSLASTDEDRIARAVLERIRTMEAEMASLRWSEKNFEAMETRNEE